MSADLVGTLVFAGYRITKELGEGGMGAVFAAEDPNLGKKIAVKVLHPEFAKNPEIVERFLAEARSAAALDHKNIIEILACGQLADGSCYIAMEFLEGRDLADYLAEWGPLAPGDALEILLQICSGLAEAHFRQITHRDLKPQNVFIIQRRRSGSALGAGRISRPHAKILDFGLAKIGDAQLAGAINTRTKQVFGTPQYMAPEQARGSKFVDPRADIYALGVIAYQMVTNRLPYSGANLGEIVHQHLTIAPAAPHMIDARIPLAWSQAIMSAIDCDPLERPQSVQQFARLLIEATEGGEAIARKVEPDLLDTAAPHDATAKARDSHSPETRPATPAALGYPTSLSGAAMARPGTAAPQRRYAHWIAGGVLVALLGGGGVLLALRSSDGDANKEDTVAAEPPPAPSVDAAAAPMPAVTVDAAVRRTRVRIVTKPAGAQVSVAGKLKGPAPVSLNASPGAELVVNVSLDGFEDAERTVIVPRKAEHEVRIALTKTRKVRATRPATTRKRGTRARDKRPSAERRTRTFDPDVPAGTD